MSSTGSTQSLQRTVRKRALIRPAISAGLAALAFDSAAAFTPPTSGTSLRAASAASSHLRSRRTAVGTQAARLSAYSPRITFAEGNDALANINTVIAEYGVQLPNDGDIPYMGQDGQYYSLSPEEELRALDAVRKAGDLLRVQSKLQAKANRAPTLSAWAKAARLSEAGLKQALANGLAAKRLLVATNIPLVYNIVYKQYVKKIARECLQVSVNDLIQEGILGLAHAVELYNGSRSAGARFRTYAWYWIKAYIDQGILSGGHAVKLPRRAMQAYDSAVRTLTAQLQRSPTEDEIAKHMGLSTEELSRKYSIAKGGGMLSLDSRFSDGGDMQDHLLNVRAVDTEGEEALQGRDLRAALQTALSPRERELLALRFGLDDGRQRTIKECAQAMMLSLNVTRQLLDGSIAKVRAHILTQEADVLEASAAV